MKYSFRKILSLCFSAMMLAELHGQTTLWEKAKVDLNSLRALGPADAVATNVISNPEQRSLRSVSSNVATEIAQLAASLGNDPLRIFNHVRNKIDYEPYHGLRKGAVLTLLEGSGNDFDQCVLLADLLKAAGYSNVHFRLRSMFIEYDDLMPWFGLAAEPYPGKSFQQVTGITIQDYFGANHNGVGESIAKKVLHATSFVKSFGYQFNGGEAGYWSVGLPTQALIGIDRLYLNLTINGTTYDLDPAYKHYEEISGVTNLLQSLGYNRASLLAAVGGGSDVNYALNLNEPALKAQLDNLTSTLLNALHENYHGYTLQEIINGRRIIKQDAASLSEASPINTIMTGVDMTWNAIPEDYQSKLRLKTDTLDFTIPTASLEGRKLSLTFNGNTLEVRLDDAAPVATDTITAATFSLNMIVSHPVQPAKPATLATATTPASPATLAVYDSQESTAIYKKANQFAYCIPYGFRSGTRLLDMRHEILDEMLASGKADSSREVKTELLNIMGLTWLQQTELVHAILARLNQTRYTYHHRFGRTAQEEGFYIDVSLQYQSSIKNDGSSDNGSVANVFHLGSLISSAMEHGVLQQMQNRDAVSTVNIIRKANAAGQRIYKTDKSNWKVGGTVKSALQNYTTAQKSQLEALIQDLADPARILLPRNANVTYGVWEGSGWAIRSNQQTGMIISGNYNGGYATNYGFVISPIISTSAAYNPTFVYAPPISGHPAFTVPNFSLPRFYGSDPVNMATGAFEYAHTDIETGIMPAPRGLAFSRDYSSARSTKNSHKMGYGWTHNLDMSLVERTATEESLGQGTNAQVAPLLIACLVGADLYREIASPQEWTSAVLVTAWFQDWMLNNAVSISIGNQAYQFLKMPNGTYEAPAGNTMTLEKLSNGYQLSQRNGNRMIFNKYVYSVPILDSNGVQLGTTLKSYTKVQKIIDPDGKELNFTYYTGLVPLGPYPPGQQPISDYGMEKGDLLYVSDCYGRSYGFDYIIYSTNGKTRNLISKINEFPSVNGVARTVSFEYDEFDNLISATDPEGKRQYYDYKVTGDPSATPANEHRIVRLRNHDNQTITQNIYNPLGQVIEQRLHGDPAKTWKLRYTGNANTERNPNGDITTYYYDDQGRATGKTDASGNTELWTFDGEDRLVKRIVGAQNSATAETTIQVYDRNHNLLEIHHPRGGGVTYNTYDALHRQLTQTDPDGRTITYTYNPDNNKNRPDAVTDPSGTTTYQYKPTGAAIGLLWKETRGGLSTEYEYDATYGQPLWVKQPGGFQVNAVINARGDISEITDANNVKTTFTHNLRRQPLITTANATSASPSISETTYNNQGLPNSELAPPHNNGHRNKTRQAYNPTEKPTITTYKDNDGEGANDPFTEVLYDGRDWQKTAYDLARRPSVFTPYPNGLLEKTTLPGNKTTTTIFDSHARPLTAIAPGNNISPTLSTSYIYTVSGASDPSGPGYPKGSITTPDNLTTTTITNHSGQTRFLKDRRGNQWETQYDAAGRVWKLFTPLGKLTTHTYNSFGDPDTITEPSLQTTSHSYHPSTGRLSSVTDPTGVLNIQSYDNNGKVLTQSETRSGQTYVINQTYTPLGKLQSRTDEFNQTVDHRYYPSGAKWKTIYPGGTENGVGHVEYTYYPDGKLWQVIDKLTSSTAPRISTYAWYKDGRLRSLSRPNGTVRSIMYHADGQPSTVTEHNALGTPLYFAKHEFYPNNSLRHRYTLPAAPAGTTPPPISLTYNSDNQILTYNGQSLTHDPDGNLTLMPLSGSSSLHSAVYNSRNQLTSINGTTYDYDSQGHRKSVTTGGIQSNVTHDTSSRLARQIVRTKNGQSTRTVWGLGVLYEVNSDGSVVYHHHDLTGSTIALSDSGGTIIERIAYSAYGQVLSRSSINNAYHDTPYLFTGFYGNETDATSLVHMRARFYSPLLHRFLNSDPAREGNNWYGYAAGNPLGFVDPSGLGIEGALDTVQTVLSYLGMLPVVGPVFDIINAGISFARGNYVDAALNLASAVPGIGDLAGAAKIAGVATAGYSLHKGTQALTRAGYSFSGNLYMGLPIPTRSVPSMFDIISYRRAAPGFEKHHGVLDAWARNNVAGYSSRGAPTVVLTNTQHNKTRSVFNTWRAENGFSRKAIDWSSVSPQEAQQLTYRMFAAAGVPENVVSKYFKAFNKFLYE